jgi:hypothetical protein
MKKRSNRREFLKDSSKICIACGVFALCPNINAFTGSGDESEIPDPKKLCYCGYTCPPDCPMYIGTIENDTAKKKEAYDMWKIKERYGVEFEEEKVFCYGCKNNEKPLGLTLEKCPVRKCTIEKGYDCCIECSELQACEKGLWERFPDFHKSVIEMQKKYNEANIGA